MDQIRIPEPLPLPLWPAGTVPGSLGDAPVDVPTITPYLLPPGERPRGAVVVCPGGGYARLAPHEGEPVARWLNGIGIAAFVLRYRVAPYRHPHPLLDAQRAMRTVRHLAARWGIDASKVALLGFSAGGHLAVTAGTHHDAGVAKADDPIERRGCRPDALVLCYPVVSFHEPGHPGSLANLVGAGAPEDLRLFLSGEAQVCTDTPPAFVWHTSDDAAVPALHSILFCSALARHGVRYELHVYESGRHGLGLAADNVRVGTWTQHCGAWLLGMGYGG
jgi:acetyl esterase/lipase